jgi:hypothetical protein
MLSRYVRSEFKYSLTDEFEARYIAGGAVAVNDKLSRMAVNRLIRATLSMYPR